MDDIAGGVRHCPGDVGLGEHADEAVIVDHRQTPQLVLGHQAQGVLEGVVVADGDRFALGEVAGPDGRRVAGASQYG